MAKELTLSHALFFQRDFPTPLYQQTANYFLKGEAQITKEVPLPPQERIRIGGDILSYTELVFAAAGTTLRRQKRWFYFITNLRPEEIEIEVPLDKGMMVPVDKTRFLGKNFYTNKLIEI